MKFLKFNMMFYNGMQDSFYCSDMYKYMNLKKLFKSNVKTYKLIIVTNMNQ